MGSKRKSSWLRASLRRLRLLRVGSEKGYLLDHLSVLLDSGLDIVTALKAIAMDTKNRVLKSEIMAMVEAVLEGEKVWRVMENTGMFDIRCVSMVRIGEETGRLAGNLMVIATQNQKDRVFRSKLIGAITYPLFVVLLGIGVGIWVLLYLLPQLSATFASLNIDLPFLTRALMDIGAFIQAHWWWIAASGAGLFLVLWIFLFALPQTRAIGQALLFLIPGVGAIIRYSENARLGFLLGSMLGTGLPLPDALRSITRTAYLCRDKKFFSYLYDRIEEGRTFEQTFAEYKRVSGVLSVPMQQMVIAAERSGTIPKAFDRIGKFYEFRANMATKNLSIVLEPLLLLLIGAGVLLLALSVVLPIYSIISGLE